VENKVLSEIKRDMIKEALSLYKDVYPPTVCSTFEECFTFEENKILLWINTPDLTTRLIQRELPSKKN